MNILISIIVVSVGFSLATSTPDPDPRALFLGALVVGLIVWVLISACGEKE